MVLSDFSNNIMTWESQKRIRNAGRERLIIFLTVSHKDKNDAPSYELMSIKDENQERI